MGIRLFVLFYSNATDGTITAESILRLFDTTTLPRDTLLVELFVDYFEVLEEPCEELHSKS